ncbi:small ribosomal subunit protein mS40 [Culicoides brevitarsis]|uniref:small ribosomal subunit protein mS40 n=1 Tax=Culicoides brevitarsis TaxID=469753 RepID=UPI00307B2EB9
MFTKIGKNLLLVTSFSKFANVTNTLRPISTTPLRFCDHGDDNPDGKDKKKPVKPELDRTKIIPVETSIRYLASEAYKTTYGTEPVWVQYRRNHKGQLAPRKTRRTCIRGGVISTGSPCPICRDEYLVLDYNNLELLKQFISPYTGDVLSYSKTGLCQKKHQQLLVAIERARDRGLLTFELPFREYDYSEYYGKDWKKKATSA